MTKEDHIAHWRKEAELNWETAIYLKDGRQNLMALFLLHLVTEKLLKGHWVKDNIDNFPPRSHDLQYILNQTDLETEAEYYDYLAIINQWNIDTRYPDYKNKLYSIATNSYIETHFERVSKLRKWLLEKF